MDMLPFNLVRRVSVFSARTRQTISDPLGSGKDGTVFTTSRGTAVKFVSDPSVYRRERDAYLRLKEKRVRNVHGFNVPQYTSHHDEISAIEMTVVQPPFIVDFASAYLDERPDFPEDVEQDYQERLYENFSDNPGDAADVQALLNELGERHGVYMLDARPANIRFRN